MEHARLKRVRARLADAQGHRCCYCRRPFGEGALLCTLEHKRAKMKGGGDRIPNLAAACRHCNQHRGRQMNAALQRKRLLNPPGDMGVPR